MSQQEKQTASQADASVRESERNSPGILAEFFDFLLHHKKWWLTPIILVLVLMGFLIIQVGGSVVAPFIYPYF